MSTDSSSRFQQAATDHVQRGFLAELWNFIRRRKKWWLIPILVALFAFAALIFLSGTGVAPFIYTLF